MKSWKSEKLSSLSSQNNVFKQANSHACSISGDMLYPAYDLSGHWTLLSLGDKLKYNSLCLTDYMASTVLGNLPQIFIVS